MLDDAFEALTKYDWGTDREPLAPIEAAVAAAHGNADVRKNLEVRLIAALKSDISRDAKDYACRKLAIVGTPASVPTLAGLLADENHSHMARFALERIPAPEAAQALRDALSKVGGNVKIGVISSIGARRDGVAVPALGRLLKDSDASVARAAATALGDIGNVEAAQALKGAKPSAAETRQAVIDAQLTCAEALLSDNNQAGARAIYKSLAGDDQAKLVRLAATRGMLACAAKNA
jgi:HEAT repeat protein